MTASQLRQEARANLTGKWGKGALITLCYFLIMWAISFVLAFIPMLGSIASMAISIPISYGLICSFMKLKRNEEVSYTGFLNYGFNSFAKSWAVAGNILLKMIIPIVVLIVAMVLMSAGIFAGSAAALSGSSSSAGMSALAVISTILYIVAYVWIIVKSFLYVLAYYILFDNKDMSGKEIVEKSAELMKGHRWAYFWLSLSFIGWAILAAFTFGIGYFWLAPYMMIATIFFYENLAEKSDVNPVKEENVEAIEEQ